MLCVFLTVENYLTNLTSIAHSDKTPYCGMAYLSFKRLNHINYRFLQEMVPVNDSLG